MASSIDIASKGAVGVSSEPESPLIWIASSCIASCTTESEKTVFLGILPDLVGLNIGSSSLAGCFFTALGGAGKSPLPRRSGVSIALLEPPGMGSASSPLPSTGSKAVSPLLSSGAAVVLLLTGLPVKSELYCALLLGG
jgi:hypothetical protein